MSCEQHQKTAFQAIANDRVRLEDLQRVFNDAKAQVGGRLTPQGFAANVLAGNTARRAGRISVETAKGRGDVMLGDLYRAAKNATLGKLSQRGFAKVFALAMATGSPTPSLTAVGGQTYDSGRLNGHQYNKRLDPSGSPYVGQTFTSCGKTWTIGDKSSDPADFGAARRAPVGTSGAAPPPKDGGVIVGRIYEKAADILKDAKIVRAPDGSTEVYDAQGNLLSAYDPVAGSTADSNNNGAISPAQMAAAMAHTAYHAQPPLTSGKFLREDLEAVRAGKGSALAVADSTYLALETGNFGKQRKITFGGKLNAEHCPNCGKFAAKSGCQNCAALGLTVDATPAPAKSPAMKKKVSPADKKKLADAARAKVQLPTKPTLPPVTGDGVGFAPTPPDQQTGQEHVFDNIILPSPDPTLAAIPPRLGGQLREALNLAAFIPPVDPDFEINEDTEKALRTISAALQTNDPAFKAFFLFGKPGSGKNTILEQLAASVKTVDANGNVRQGVPYYEADITEDTNVDDLIGGTVIENGSTYWRPGPLSIALMSGSVCSLNEIVRRPKAATLLQSIMEKREIQVKTPDGGFVKVAVHPASIVAMTGNPGADRDPDRPGAAAFTRTIPIKVEYGTKEERMRRAAARYSRRIGAANPIKGAPKINVKARDYTARLEPLTAKELTASVEFFDEVETLIEGKDGNRQVQLRTGGGAPVLPGPRGMDRFLAIGKATGNWGQALEMLKGYCTQEPSQYAKEWALVQMAFDRKFVKQTDGTYKV